MSACIPALFQTDFIEDIVSQSIPPPPFETFLNHANKIKKLSKNNKKIACEGIIKWKRGVRGKGDYYGL
jgi:hypothetical protein